MIRVSADILSFTGEPALLVKGGKILFANEAACALLGQDCRSKSFQELFGKEIAGMQASSFVGEAQVSGRRVLLRVRAVEGMRVVFLSPCAASQELIGDAFLYTLRNELMQLRTNAAYLRSKLTPDSAGMAQSLNGISMSLYRIDRTLHNLSIIRNAETNSVLYCPQTFNLAILLRDVIEATRLCISAPEICFTAPESLLIEGAPSLLETLTLNLLSNCILHAEGCTRIRVTLHSAGGQTILSVDDDGCGIASEKLNTVLERYRYDCELSEAGRGPGLGLTAVREIARAHGGTLLLESREGIGTAVRVSLGSLSKAGYSIRSAEVEYSKRYDTILMGLSSCLPPKAFDEPDR